MDLCADISGIVTATIKSPCFDLKKNDRYTIVYSYPENELDLIITNVVNDTLTIVSGSIGFLSENMSITRNGISIIIAGKEAFLNTGGATPVLTYNFSPVSLVEAPAGTFTGDFDVGIYNYEFSYVSGTDILTITIRESALIINTIVINGTTGEYTVS